MIRIIIADDHPVVRAGVSQIVARSEDIRVAGEADSGESLLREILKASYDVVVMDMSMPGMGGIETLKRIKAVRPRLPVLILSIHPEDQLASPTLKAGASGYLNKTGIPEELIRAIRQVVAGRKYVSAEYAAKLAAGLGSDGAQSPHHRLSDREFQVFCSIVNGKPLTEIASDLGLSIKTIGTYRTRILEKMELSTNAALVAYAVKNNLCPVS
jgi:DNA-binding NarL/FixJ family response regulator